MQTQQPSPQQQRKVFRCALCAFESRYDSFGPSTLSPALAFLENCYSLTDPFSPLANHSVAIGAHCSLCDKPSAHDSMPMPFPRPSRRKLPEIGRPQPPVETAPDIIKG
ncbi:hypothetical protein PAPYR_13208 [Paratrimastix pyriformis]|uniref:Cysteine-rich DPF motif domain-containing protein 1 n=1 Tax=Paratrimastix pyriformis TaxID=342808 RepID=A0ABQ8U4T6_9EUKA|nr:hypothetical protein PAPYR_13208 [Paratrimastix pyriformis]